MNINEKIIKLSELYGMSNFQISVELNISLEDVFDAIWENENQTI